MVNNLQTARLSVAWPSGITSVLYLLMAVIALGSEGYERIISVITLSLMLSIFLHGVSAAPLSKIFKKSEG